MVSHEFTTRRRGEIEISDLCEDLLENILLRVPLKPRTRLKLVSKGWCKIITSLRKSHPPTTSSGLVLIGDGDHLRTATLVYVHDQGKECTLQSSIRVLDDQPMIRPRFKVSFRGFLLYSGISTPYDGKTRLYVSNPTLYNNCNHYIALPPINDFMFKQFFRVGFYPHEKGDQFNVVCFITFCMAEKMDCYFLSSDTMKWINICDVPLYNPSLSRGVIVARRYLRPQSVYNNRKLYWLYGKVRVELMLVYNIDGHFFKFIGLPSQRSTRDCHDLLYVSEDGCLFYCEIIFHKIVIWTYLGIDDDNGEDDDDPYSMRWSITHNVAKSKLLEQIKEAYGPQDVRELDWVPIAFNAELRTLYLRDESIIWAYSIETRQITRVWCSSEKVSINSQSFDFSPLQTT